MDAFKIENFKASHEEKAFPSFIHLSKVEAKTIYDSFSRIFLGSKNSDPVELVNCISSSSIHIEAFNALSDNFRFKAVLQYLSVESEYEVYLNWYRFDDIDKIDMIDFDKYFDDIWYPSSDDIDIFDKCFSWIISIRHDGALTYWKA